MQSKITLIFVTYDMYIPYSLTILLATKEKIEKKNSNIRVKFNLFLNRFDIILII